MTGPCEKKRTFTTERAARDELARITVRAMLGERRGKAHWSGDEATLETGTYECRCGGWHLTSRPWDGNVVSPLTSDPQGSSGVKSTGPGFTP